MKSLYTASARSTGGGRDGHVRSADGWLDLDVAAPSELGGTGGATNPEQLFAAGYAACFHSALRAVAQQQKAQFSDSAVSADVTIGSNDAGGFGLAVSLRIELRGIDQASAEDLAAAAHQVCPYSNATQGNVDVVVDVAVA